MRIPAHSVCTAIRDDIVSGVFERGSRLTEEVLARRYGVSRVPVREALRTLESEGFVVTRRHAGACVAEPTGQEAADLLEIRMLLEPLGAARAAQRRTEAHLKVLRGLVKLGQERVRRGRARTCAPWAAGSTRRWRRPREAPRSSRCSPSSGTRSPGCTPSSSRRPPRTPGPSTAPSSTRWRAVTRSGPGRSPSSTRSGPPRRIGCGVRRGRRRARGRPGRRRACGLRVRPG